MFRSTFSDKTAFLFCGNKENWLPVPKEFKKSGDHNYVKHFKKKKKIKKKRSLQCAVFYKNKTHYL